MVYQKSVRRALRRCAAMGKLAVCITCLVMLSGLLHAVLDQNAFEAQGRHSLKYLSRHQRRISEDRPANDDDLPFQAATREKTPSRTPSAILTDEQNEIARRKNNRILIAEPLTSHVDKHTPKPKLPANAPSYMSVDYYELKTKEYKDREREIQKKWRKRINQKIFDEKPPNPSFIFHNKLPKSGSSTMNNILKKLSQLNNFNFLKMETSDTQTSDDGYLIKELKSKIKEPYMLLKHHRFLNFTKNNQLQPTYINVMRDPLEWFTSRYYFSRYGWERKPGCRKSDCGMSEEDRLMEIDDCVKKRHRECMNPWMYIQFFCGTAPECYNVTTLEQKGKATEIAKKNILDEYYIVGVLEQFEDTLKLFEVMMPKFFKNAVPTWKSEFIQTKQRMTKTTYKREMSEKSKEFFRNGPLHYEIELYNFGRELFNEKLRHFHIKSTVNA